MTTQDNTEKFQLDDPLEIKGEITSERAAQIIARMNQLLADERNTTLNIPIYYR